MQYQGNMFGKPKPIFEDCPEWFRTQAERILWLWEEGKDQKIADNDSYMQVKYWMEYEGLARALGEEGAKNFAYWYCEHNPTPAETLRRARQYLTSDSNHKPHMESSEDIRKKRNRKREMITAQMGSPE